MASWPRCHMVALGSHDHSGVLLEVENCLNKSTRMNGMGIPSTVISAAAQTPPKAAEPRQGWSPGAAATALHTRMPIPCSESWPWKSLVFRPVHWHSSSKLLLKFLARLPSAARSCFCLTSVPGTEPAWMTQRLGVRASWPLFLPTNHSLDEVPG